MDNRENRYWVRKVPIIKRMMQETLPSGKKDEKKNPIFPSFLITEIFPYQKENKNVV